MATVVGVVVGAWCLVSRGWAHPPRCRDPPERAPARANRACTHPAPTARPRSSVVPAAATSSLVVEAKQNSLKRQRTAETARMYNKARKSEVATRMKKVRRHCRSTRSRCSAPRPVRSRSRRSAHDA